MGRKPRKKFSCDFETTTDKTKDGEEARVWAFGCMEIGNEENFTYGTCIEDFMVWAEKSQCDCYFHNLAFDGEYIVNHLMLNGWEYSEEPKEKTFKGVITPSGWYSITLCYGFERPKRSKPRKKHTTIYDAYKKLPYSVKDLAKAFNLPISKGEIDHEIYRPVGHVITDNELDYLKRDVSIVAKALESQFQQGLTGMTIGIDAMRDFKNIFGRDKFDRFFPKFSLELHEDIQPFYKGGFNWINDKFQEELLGEGLVLDAVSNYPSQMKNKPMPFGFPEFYFGKYEPDEKYSLYMQLIKCDFVLKDGCIPSVQVKNIPGKEVYPWASTEWLKSSQFEEPYVYLTGPEMELFFENYHVYDLEYIGGWKFQAATGIFDEYINKWFGLKNKYKRTAIGENAKLMLNNLPGKFATGLDRTKVYPELKEDGSLEYWLPVDEDGNVVREYGEPVYLPIAIFVTAYARCDLIRIAQSVENRYIYSDTDSIHVTGLEIPEALKSKIGKDELGYWKVESEFEKAYYIKPKTYAHIQYGKTVQTGEEEWEVIPCSKEEADSRIKALKCSGLPEKIKEGLSFKQFKRGLRIESGKPQAVHVKGGVILKSAYFQIR